MQTLKSVVNYIIETTSKFNKPLDDQTKQNIENII